MITGLSVLVSEIVSSGPYGSHATGTPKASVPVAGGLMITLHQCCCASAPEIPDSVTLVMPPEGSVSRCVRPSIGIVTAPALGVRVLWAG